MYHWHTILGISSTKEINLNTKGGAKIGIAGRTSAGKSSFIAAVMRMPSADGDITINDIPVKEVNIQETRQCISLLGQNPVLLRYFWEEIWMA